MIQAKHHIVLYPLSKWLYSYLLKRHFNTINIESDFIDNGCSVLVVANHMSWWDGFWVEHVNRKIIGKKFHFMMLEDQLKKHWLLKYVGGYSIKKNSRDVIRSVGYTVDVLKNNGNMVLMFPQGKIHSSHNHNFYFNAGINSIVSKCHDDTQVLLVANFVDYFSDVKPNVFIYTKSILVKCLKNNPIEKEYNLFFNEVLSRQKAKTS